MMAPRIRPSPWWREFKIPVSGSCGFPSTGGAGHARNIGIQDARSEWIAFLDSDDEWLPQMLERLVVRLRECGDPLATVAYCRCTVRDALTARMWCQPRVLYGGDVFGRLLSGWHPPTLSVFLVKRTSMLEVGDFDEELPYAEDYDLWLRLAEAHNHFAAVGERLVIKYDYEDQR